MQIENESNQIVAYLINQIKSIKGNFYEILNVLSIKNYGYQPKISFWGVYNNKNLNDVNIENQLQKIDPLELFYNYSKGLITSINRLNKCLTAINSYVEKNFHYLNEKNNKIKKFTDSNNNHNKKTLTQSEINENLLYFINNLHDILIYNIVSYKCGQNINFLFTDNSYTKKLSETFILEPKKNIFDNIIKKLSIIQKYYKNLTIKITEANDNQFYMFSIIIKNMIKIKLIFTSNFYNKEITPQNLNKFVLIKVNGINVDENSILYLRLNCIFMNELKNIFFNNRKKYFIESLILFFEFIYDYQYIFKIKCLKCNKNVKYSFDDKFFYPPLLRDKNINGFDSKKLMNDIGNGRANLKDIEKEEKIINENIKFYHEECI